MLHKRLLFPNLTFNANQNKELEANWKHNIWMCCHYLLYIIVWCKCHYLSYSQFATVCDFDIILLRWIALWKRCAFGLSLAPNHIFRMCSEIHTRTIDDTIELYYEQLQIKLVFLMRSETSILISTFTHICEWNVFANDYYCSSGFKAKIDISIRLYLHRIQYHFFNDRISTIRS